MTRPSGFGSLASFGSSTVRTFGGAARLASAAFAATVVACTALGGCTTEIEEEDVATGDTFSEDALVSERQLMGSELPEKTLSLTFDDGPGPRTAELAEFLASKGIKATFFINGKNVPGRQAAIDTIIARGHLLANHTQNHLQLTKLASAKAVKEIADTDAFIVDAQPTGPSLLRAPFGAWNGSLARAVNTTPMKKYVGSIFWDIGGELTSTSAADWDCWGKGVSVDRCATLYTTEIQKRKRGIVLMHDVHSKTIDMVKAMVPNLINSGYSFARVDDVPSVKRALGNVSAPTAETDCFSSSLGRNTPEGTCVQSRRDQIWYRCTGEEWTAVSGANDAKCTGQKFPL